MREAESSGDEEIKEEKKQVALGFGMILRDCLRSSPYSSTECLENLTYGGDYGNSEINDCESDDDTVRGGTRFLREQTIHEHPDEYQQTAEESEQNQRNSQQNQHALPEVEMTLSKLLLML